MTHDNLRKLILAALFTAIMVVMKVTGIGLINLGIISVTVYCTIIAIGTLAVGLKTGLILGVAFATMSFVDCFKATTGLVLPLMQYGFKSWCLVFLMCYTPRLLVPVVVYTINRTIEKQNTTLGLTVSSVCGSLCNTVLFLGIMLLDYALIISDYSGISEQGLVGILSTIAGIAGTAGIAEAIFAGIVAPTIVSVLRRVDRKK